MAKVEIVVNGMKQSGDVEDRTLLVNFLRDSLGLTGTHVGCDTTQCGCCTVHMNGRAVKSCTVLAVQADGARLDTVEGLGRYEQCDRLREAFSRNGGLQCGFCTPGFLVTALELLRDPDAEKPLCEQSVREALSGNICRCTGYQGIVQAVLDAAAPPDPGPEAEPD